MRIQAYRFSMIYSYLYTILVFYAQCLLNYSISPIILVVGIAAIIFISCLPIKTNKQFFNTRYLDSYRSRYKWMMIGIGIFIGVMYFGRPQRFEQASVSGGLGLMVYLTSTCLMLQSLSVEKHGSGKKEFYSLQMKKHLIFYAVSLMLYVLYVPHLLVGGAAEALHLGTSALHQLFPDSGQIMDLDFSLDDFSRSAAVKFQQLEKEKEEKYDIHDDREQIEQKTEPVEQERFTPEQVRRAFFILGVVLTVIAFIVILFIIMTHGKKNIVYEDFSEEREQMDGPVKKPVKVHRFSKEDAHKARYYYLRFLKKCSKRKIPVTLLDTTRQIQKKYITESPENQAQMEQMTQLYRKNRYDERHQTTKEELLAMKELERKL